MKWVATGMWEPASDSVLCGQMFQHVGGISPLWCYQSSARVTTGPSIVLFGEPKYKACTWRHRANASDVSRTYKRDRSAGGLTINKIGVSVTGSVFIVNVFYWFWFWFWKWDTAVGRESLHMVWWSRPGRLRPESERTHTPDTQQLCRGRLQCLCFCFYVLEIVGLSLTSWRTKLL